MALWTRPIVEPAFFLTARHSALLLISIHKVCEFDLEGNLKYEEETKGLACYNVMAQAGHIVVYYPDFLHVYLCGQMVHKPNVWKRWPLLTNVRSKVLQFALDS